MLYEEQLTMIRINFIPRFKNLKMGQHCCKQQASALLSRDWTRVPTTSGPLVWKNNNTGQLIEEYAIMNDNEESHKRQLAIINVRYNHPHLVSSKGFIDQSSSDFCGCSTSYQGGLFLEIIPYTLSNLNEIPYPDVLHIYDQAFKGYQAMIPYVGYFIVEEDMIGINSSDIAKVWINGKLSKNQVDSMRLKSEAEMIETIVDVIDRNTQTGLHFNLKQFFIQRNPQTFAEAIQLLQEFSALHRMTIPSKLTCITEMRLGKSTTIVQSNVNQVIVNTKQSQIVGNGYSRPMLSSVRSTGALIRPSRVLSNSIVNKTLIHQGSVKRLAPRVVSKHIAQPHLQYVSPVNRNGVSISPVRAPVKPVTQGFPTPLSVTTALKLSQVPKLNIPKPVPNPSSNIHQMKVEDGHSSSQILDIIRSSRQQTANLRSRNLLPSPKKDGTSGLVSARYLEQKYSNPIPIPIVKPEIVIQTKPILQTTQLRVEEKAAEILETPKIIPTLQDISPSPKKYGDQTTDYKINDRIQTVSRVVETQEKQVINNIQSPTHHKAQQQLSSSGATSFEFFGFVGMANSQVQRTKQLSVEKLREKRVVKEQTHLTHHYQQTKVSEELSEYTANIESRLQAPSEASAAFQQYNSIKQSTVNGSVTTGYPVTTTHIEQKYTRTFQSPVKPIEPSYSHAYQTKNYVESYMPITSRDDNINTYNPSSSNNYMDIYNISSSYSSYVPVGYDYASPGYSTTNLSNNNLYNTNYSSNDYYSSNNYNTYADPNKYSYTSNYAQLDSKANQLLNKYSPNYEIDSATNFKTNDNTNFNTNYNSNYNTNYNLNSYTDYNTSSSNYNVLDSYKPVTTSGFQTYKNYSQDTYIVPKYDTFNIPKYEEIKDYTYTYTPTPTYTQNFKSSHDLKQTQITTTHSNFHNNQSQASNNNYTHQYEQYSHHQTKNVSTEGYNLQHLASIYIPIQGYKVTLDNQLLDDMIKLRARGLMEEAIVNEAQRKARNAY